METHIQEAILGLHAFTGCDVTSAFVQKGKVRPLRILQKHPEFSDTFKELGTSETISAELVNKLEKFVCHLYGKPAYSSTNKLRHDLVRLKYMAKGHSLLSCFDGFDISLLPPCRDALKLHIQRANYQTFIWKQAHLAQPLVPDPQNHGWNRGYEGMLSVEWCKDLVPQQLADVLTQSDTVKEDISESGQQIYDVSDDDDD